MQHLEYQEFARVSGIEVNGIHLNYCISCFYNCLFSLLQLTLMDPFWNSKVLSTTLVESNVNYNKQKLD